MQQFFSNDIDDLHCTLYDEEARHCTQVLRKRIGDTIAVVDGNGGYFEGVIEGIPKRSCIIKITKRIQQDNPLPVFLHIAIAPTKNISRFEWFLEKATEIGIHEITPLICDHSERKRIRPDRLNKLLIAAMKQSRRTYLPKLNALASFAEFMKNDFPDDMQKFIAHCVYEENIHLINNYHKGKDVTILIGPEGDFSDEEVELALKSNFSSTGLGKFRLRTETAGLVACHTIQLSNELLVSYS